LATEALPIVPPAPGRFSITNDWPTCLETWSSTTRAMMSPALPALTALTTSIWRDGQSYAGAEELEVNRTAAATAAHHARDDVI
jgi:hypothetical protein